MEISHGKYILKVRLTEYIFSLKKKSSDYIIAKTVLEIIDDFPEIYIHEIAFLTHTTVGTVSKFFNKLGYEGFSQIKDNSEVNYSFSSILPLINDFGGTFQEKTDAYLNQIQAFQKENFSFFNSDEVRRIASEMHKYQKIYVLSGIHGFAAANYFSEIADQIKKNVIPLHRDVENSIILDILQEDAMIFVISLTGDFIKKMDTQLSKELFNSFTKKAILLCSTDKIMNYNFKEFVNIWNLRSVSLSNSLSDNALHQFFTSLIFHYI